MADNNGGGSNVAIVVIFILVLAAVGAGIFLWQGGYFSGEKTDINVDIKVPSGGEALPAPK